MRGVSNQFGGMEMVSRSARSVSRRDQFRLLLRRLLRRDTSSPQLLMLAAATGLLTGLICCGFELGLDALSASRLQWLQTWPPIVRWGLAFFSGAVMAGLAIWLAHRFAPEAGGSGIPEIEGALEGLRPVRWQRVLPVKFFGGLTALGSGMILGREGPSVQIGGNLGAMLAAVGKDSPDGRHALLAAGAAAGLTAAFNAPLAGILFVLEELRAQFRYSFVSVKAVSVAVICATLVRHALLGDHPVFAVPELTAPPLAHLAIFVLLGCVAGGCGAGFNWLVAQGQDAYLAWHRGRRPVLVATVAVVGGLFGVLSLTSLGWHSGGMTQIPQWMESELPFSLLLGLLLWRTLGTLLCFCSGIPGGIFAPLLALGTLLGLVWAQVLGSWFPNVADSQLTLGLVGMSALFAASVRAPVTGILLVTEMSNNFTLILPMMLATLSATLVAQALGGKPLYSQILARTLRLAQPQQSNEKPATVENT